MVTDTGVVSRSVVLTPRTPRVVVVLPERACVGAGVLELRSSFHRSLEWLGRVWGGAFMSVVPTVDGVVPDVFVRLMRVYDPDVVLPWVVNVAELAGRDVEAARSAHDAWQRAAERTTVTVGVVGSTKAVETETTEDTVGSGAAETRPEVEVSVLFGDKRPLLMRQPDVDACAVLREQLSALPESQEIGLSSAYASHMQRELPGPLTKIQALQRTWSSQRSRSQWGRPVFAEFGVTHSVLDIDMSSLDPWLATSMKIRLGVTGVGWGPRANEHEEGEVIVSRTFDGANERNRGDAAHFAVGGFSGWAESGAWNSPAGLGQAPMDRSAVGLGVYTWGGRQRHPSLVVVGETVADATLYLCWTRVYGPNSAVWLPGSVLNALGSHSELADEAEHFLDAAKEVFQELPHPMLGPACITSFSVSQPQLSALRDHMASRRHFSETINVLMRDMTVALPDELEVSWVGSSSVAVSETVRTSTNVVFRDDVAQSPVRSPVPSIVTESIGFDSLDVDWVCDAVIDSGQWPPRNVQRRTGGSDQYIDMDTDVALASRGLLRYSKTGTSWAARNREPVPVGINAQHALSAPVLRAVDMASALDLLADSGWGWHLSSCGRFYEGFEQLAGGLQKLLSILRHPTIRVVLDSFVNRRVGSTGYHLEGRWVLTFDQFVESLNATSGQSEPSATDELVNAVDSLTSMSIVVRGLRLKCSRCRYMAFYRMRDISAMFTCKRCSDAQDVGVAAWQSNAREPEPLWSFALDELVYQALDHNIDGPAFALDALGATDDDTHYSWPVQLIPPDASQGMEVDFVVLRQGRLTVGEAKTNDHLGDSGSKKGAAQEINKTVDVARHLHASDVVFATTQPHWADRTRTQLNTSRPRSMEITVLEGLT